MIKFLGTTASLLLCSISTHALEVTYPLTFTGDQEVPGPGDPDGFASGTVTVNDVTGDVAWNFTYGNIDTVTGLHFHNAPAGASAGVFLGLGTTGNGTDTLSGSLTTTPANALAINNNPDQFYVNIHTNTFGPGAVRAQVPEPGSFALIALGGAGLFIRRRRA